MKVAFLGILKDPSPQSIQFALSGKAFPSYFYDTIRDLALAGF